MKFNDGNCPGFVLRNVAGIFYLLDLNHPELQYREPLVLNESGARIWSLIESGMELGAIASKLSERFDVSLEEATADLNEFCEQLRAFGVPLEL